MRKSISSRSTFASVGFLLIPLFAANAIRSAEPVPIDDRALKQAFEDEFQARHASGEFVSPQRILSELRKEKRHPLALHSGESGESLSPAELYRQAKAATLVFGRLYLCDDCDRLHSSLAGGVLVSGDGLALTNYHVLSSRGTEIFGALTETGLPLSVEEVLASSRKDDIALVRLSGAEDLPFLRLASGPGQAEVGSEVFVVSHPDAHFYSLSRGHISRYSLNVRTRAPVLQVTAPFARGSSGSGVVNREGRLVGLVAATNSIYYVQERGKQKDLQMVVNSCVPLSSLRSLLTGAEPSPTERPGSDREASGDDAPPQP